MVRPRLETLSTGRTLRSKVKACIKICTCRLGDGSSAYNRKARAVPCKGNMANTSLEPERARFGPRRPVGGVEIGR